MFNSFIAEILLLGSVACYAATARPTITGKVVDANGKPLADTTVMVYHAGVRMGYSTFCPSCYADCGKRVLTDTNGRFQIADLSPDLWFELLAVRDAYMPQFENKVDPAKSANVTIVLSTRAVTADFRGVVRGRVVDANGSPVQDAIVHSIGVIVEKTDSAYGSLDGLQPVAVTNGNGNFEISYAKPTPKMLLNIEARAMAPSFVTLDTGPERHIVVLHDGAAITGRLVVDGRPVGNAEIGLIAKNRGGFGGNLTMTGEPYDEVRIGTRADGSFTITNVPEPVDWYLYAKMNSVNHRGATAPVEVKTSQDKEYVHAPDLIIRPDYRLKGTVLLSDNKAVPEGMHITVGSNTVWDSQTTTLASDGHFEFENLPAGDYYLSPSVKGYRVKGTTYMPFDLPVSVNHDIEAMTITVFPVNPVRH